jgi:hypothetical protein
VIEPWQNQHGRRLTDTERYAVAKMALFQAFDERASPQDMQREVLPGALDVGAILSSLDLD